MLPNHTQYKMRVIYETLKEVMLNFGVCFDLLIKLCSFSRL